MILKTSSKKLKILGKIAKLLKVNGALVGNITNILYIYTDINKKLKLYLCLISGLKPLDKTRIRRIITTINKGCILNAPLISPFNKSFIARVIPHKGQGIPILPLIKQTEEVMKELILIPKYKSIIKIIDLAILYLSLIAL